MKINTKEAIKDFTGKPIPTPDKKNFVIGTALSNILMDAKTTERVKMFVLAQKCITEDEIEVDDADLNLIKKAVVDYTPTQFHNYNNLVLGQIELYLDNLKDTKKK